MKQTHSSSSISKVRSAIIMKKPTGISDDYLICTYVEEQAIFADF